MKQIFILLLIVLVTNGVELELRKGDLLHGELICESKGSLTLKDGSSTVQIFKKSIMRVDSLDVSKSRKFTLGEQYMLIEKNELIYINSSRDSIEIHFRDGISRGVISEKYLGSGDSVTVYVADGSFSETVKYWSEGREYYTEGTPFVVESKCNEFEKLEIELKGYTGDNPPQLKGPKRAHEKE